MAAPERFAETSDSSCTAGAVHTWPITFGSLRRNDTSGAGGEADMAWTSLNRRD